MKKQFLIPLLFLFKVTYAQKGFDGLVLAEKNFASYSVSHSTKEAFLKFLDSSGIIFENGKPVNGIEAWNKREKRPGVLNWYPQFVEIAESGDFGYTTGPWTFQNSSNDSVAARGQYTTVWQINKNGEWKFLVDLGVGNTPVNTSIEVKKIDIAKRYEVISSANVDKINVSKQNLVFQKATPVVDAEKKFLKSVSKNTTNSYKKYLSKATILNRNGHLPATTATDQQKLIESTPVSIQYTIEGSGISSYIDMGYIYGTTVINGKTENYLRIWRWEKGGWKIALEVLRY